ncbi:MAG TPA: tryptophan synthase subunit alpha [Candidatus Hydrogenedens sp.]|nr:tryptophan synthase subunit alpha [Candidatus Hydrogenedens sp.]HOL19500.1 tryptophan synthase subunit alpha [Candidatus Hydrogenedens sp.]HPP59396.1 tryptophan synthase subunit alpha [Candidatus Hydrogenedens sp.]
MHQNLLNWIRRDMNRNRIEERLKTLKQNKEKTFVAYITAGYPSPDYFETIMLALDEAGVDIVEVGVPFSDPVGDGPVIQDASYHALLKGTTPTKVLEWIANVREKTEIPILLFTYFNPILVQGIPPFLKKSAQVGVDGILCVDLPIEESDTYKTEAEKNRLSTVFLVAPNSPEERIQHIVQKCSGFVYYVSRLGVTGEKDNIANDLSTSVERIKKYTDLPVLVGFGISKPQHASFVASVSDGVIVGSAFVRYLKEHTDNSQWKDDFVKYVKSLVDATKKEKESK